MMNTIRTTMLRVGGGSDELADSIKEPPDDDSRGEELLSESPHIPLSSSLFTNSCNLNFNDYLLQKHLGTGVSGKVYRALEKSSGKTVAVKFLRKDVLANGGLVRRFVGEAAIVSQFDHPGIVRIHGFGRTLVGGFFLVQDWINGLNLAQHSMREKPAWQNVARWVADAAVAIHHAHEHGIIHCDLKPANLLLDRDDRILVTDFGLARRTDDPNPLAGIAGTPGFMAPEQVDACGGQSVRRQTCTVLVPSCLHCWLGNRP